LFFAEAKQEVLIGIVMVFIFILKDIIEIKNFKIELIMLILSLMISRLSFFSLIRNVPIFKIMNNKNENNLCFYIDIINFKNINLDKILENKYNMDILEEIIINSRICCSKYILFKGSVSFFLLAIIYFLLKVLCNVDVIM
jgi:hypothetical protein